MRFATPVSRLLLRWSCGPLCDEKESRELVPQEETVNHRDFFALPGEEDRTPCLLLPESTSGSPSTITRKIDEMRSPGSSLASLLLLKSGNLATWPSSDSEARVVWPSTFLGLEGWRVLGG